jgi:hypothetical protein
MLHCINKNALNLCPSHHIAEFQRFMNLLRDFALVIFPDGSRIFVTTGDNRLVPGYTIRLLLD